MVGEEDCAFGWCILDNASNLFKQKKRFEVNFRFFENSQIGGWDEPQTTSGLTIESPVQWCRTQFYNYNVR